MRKVFKRLTAAALAAVLAVTGIPAQALAAPAAQAESPEKLELKDDYISVTVSGENGGFRIDTLEGNKLNKSDNNKFLLYPAEDYDTSYTSFSVTRKNGTKEEYIFGRDYGFLGMNSSDVALAKQGNSLTATWSVKDLTIVQTLSLLDESAAQHGMVSVAYSVTTSSNDVENVKLRLMLDTALGYQDYGVYELPDVAGDYIHIRKETMLDNQDGSAFAGTLFAVDDPGAPKVTAYTVNTTQDGQTVKPYQVGFGHWNHLASTVFDFTPDTTLDFTNPYNEMYGTADSAYALYYDLGELKPDTASEISTYYGVFSNATVSDEEKVAINFLSLPGSMALNEAKDTYLSQVDGGRAGDISVKMSVENIAPQALDAMTVVVKTQNEVLPYQDWYQNALYGEDKSFTTVIDDYQPGETAQVEAFFQVSPLPSSEYRRFEVLCYKAKRGEALTEANLLGSRDFYLYCPGTLGEKVAFTSIEPKMVYTEGTKNVYLSGQNFAMLKDPTSYVTYLKSLSGGRDVIVPAKNVVVDAEKNTMYLVVDSTLDAGSYQVVFDWNEAGKEDTTSPMLQFLASDKPEYLSPVYGIVTIEKEPRYSADDPRYRVMAYADEEEYAREMTDPNNQVLLEFRGNFSLWYDEAGNITEAKAVSLEDVQGKVSNTINISNCLDVESGSVSIVIQNPGADDQVIETNIDGKVYTTNSRTKVWDGVCAISSIENGSVSTLLQYTSDADPTENLENSVANTNAITLIWPGAASGVQTLAGIMLEFRYCQFGMMALEDGMVTDDMPKRRVIAFGAEMSPDFLVPSNYKWSERNTSTLEAVQLKIAKSNYTAEQLRDVQRRYAQDQADWEEAEGGSLALYVHDILFGGGFIGFNASVEVGLPSYADGLPGVEGVLSLKIMPMDDWWEVGVAGAADFEMLQMEASLRLKSYNGIPVPDNLYFYLGGVTPGINVDGMGIFWIQGLGGGFDNLYDTLFSSSLVPPLTLLLSGQFALFNMLQARADLGLSMRGFDVSLSNVGFAKIKLIDYMGMRTYWYPKLSMKASLGVDILDIIKGGGYLVLDENLKTGELFWEGFITASIQTPKIPIIGSITVGSADLGVNAAKIWGALHVLKLDMGVTYYWGGDVDFSFGKYDTPEPTYPVALMSDIPVYKDQKTGKVLYMSMGTNATLETEAKVNAAGSLKKASVKRAARAASSIESSVERMSHTIRLGEYTGTSDKALTVLFTADSMEEARTLACGDGGQNKGIVLKDENGAAYPLTWLDKEKDAGKQENANALLSYNEETKQASVTISFTEEESYDHTWTMASAAPADLALYDLRRLAGLESVTYSAPAEQQMTVNWTGRKLEEIEHLTVYAVAGEGEPYTLYETDQAEEIQGGTAGFAVPDTLPSGSYTVRVVASSETNSVNDILDAADGFTYTNPNQPDAPVIGSVELGGDYTLDAAVTKQADYDGYIATIYEQQTVDGEQVFTATDFAAQQIEADETGKLPDTITVGGRYETTVLTDAEGNVVSQEEAEGRTDITREKKVLGLEAGKTYCVGVRGYQITDDGESICQSAEVKSDPVVMREPAPANVTVSAEGARQLTDETVDLNAKLDTVNSEKVTIQITSDQQVSGTWYLDGTEGGEWQADGNGTLRLGADGGLAEGEHILELRGENAGGDAVRVQYRFRVDVTAPRLQIGGPANGSFFGETVTVTGLSEPGAKIHILKGTEETVVTVNEKARLRGDSLPEGSFTAEIPMDTSVLEQELEIYAEDASGNQSTRCRLKLMNELIGGKDVHLAIYVDGVDYTNQTLPAGAGGALELRAVSGEKSVAIPADSSIGRQVEWSVQTMEGTASLEGQTLTTDTEVNGILLAELEEQSAGVVLGGNKEMGSNTYVISLPQDTVGYKVETAQELVVKDGESFTFTVTVAEGYTATENFAVKVNGVPLTGENGTYVITDIHAPKTITVEGVADITAPEAKITVSENSWTEFLNTITFDIFFKDSQDVTVTATDKGSGVKKTEYHVSETALTLEQVKALAADAWKEYTGTFSISPDSECVVYARSTDQAGNIMYVSSDGMILDATAPVVKGMEDGGTYYGDQTFQVEEKYLKEIQVDGNAADASDGSIKIPADNGPHTIVVTDKAGNSATYEITVYKIYTVTFMADGVEVGTKQVNHGNSVPAEEFPEIPAKTGYDQTPPKWNPESLENVMADTTVEAVYTINNYAITLPAEMEGYQIDTDQGLTVQHGASFNFKVTFAEEYAAGADFAVKANGTALTAENGIYTIANIQGPQTITVEGVRDGVAPTAEITVKDNSWKEFLHTISFGIFFKESQDVTITAADKGSGISKTEYHLSDTALTLEEVKALTADAWTVYDGTLSIDANGKYVVYARSKDRAGNTVYVSSDGMIMDATAPAIRDLQDGAIFYGDQTFQVEEEYLEEIQLDGKTVETSDGSISIPADNAVHTIVLTDQAGNSSTYQITVYKIYTVEFVADGKTVATKQVNHGSGIPAEEFPEIPAKTGYDQTAPKWNPEKLENVTADTTVEAVYTINTYEITLPAEMVGYEIRTEQALTVEHGASFRFEVAFADEYAAGEDFAVRANGTALAKDNGIYTITGIEGPQTITVEGVKDVVSPTAEIAVENNSWKEFLHTISFGIFYKESQDVTITATDNGSGVATTEYYLSDKALTLEETEALTAWTKYTGTFSIDPDGKYVIYARSTDQAGNTAYVSSDGIVLNSKAPVIEGIENNETYYGDQTFRVECEYLDTILIDGEPVEAQDGKITVPADNQEHTIVVTDQAGNSVSYQITVYKVYKVQFVADNTLVEAKEVNHGSGIPAEEFPEIPAKTGYDQTAPKWNPESLERVTADTIVQAVYTINTYGITLPENPEGYEIRTTQGLSAQYSADFSFTVEPKEEYEAGKDFVVKANGTVLAAKDGVYTITGIDRPQTITVDGITDVVSPTAEIAVKDNSWKSFLNDISFGLFYKESQDVTITAADRGSGVEKTEYYLSDKALTLEEVKALSADQWTEYKSAFAINPDGKYVVYARSTDRAGNSVYVSSDGMITDATAPVITGMENNGVYYGDQTFQVEEEYLKEIQIDGNPAEVTDGSIKITADNEAHIIEVTDQAGNRTVYRIRVYKIYEVKFVAGGNTIATMSVNHGSSIPADKYPSIPAKTGYDQTAPKWNLESLENVTADTTVEAVYTINTYAVMLPENPVGYELRTAQELTAEHGASFSFTLTFAEEYAEGEGFAVQANGTALTAENGVYTITGIDRPQTITVDGVTDGVSPTAEITVKDNSWKEFLNTISFGLFYNESQDVTITAADKGSGVDKTEYYLSDTALALAEVKALSADQWTEYKGTFSINPDGKYVVYARSTDRAGNVVYVSSDGMVLDGTAPDITGMENNGVYYGDQTFQVKEEYLKEIQIDGNPAEVTDGSIKIAADNEAHIIEATDQAGNRTVRRIRVYKIYEVQFVADGKTVSTKQVNHGSGIPAEEFPEIPAKPGYDQTAPKWNLESLENVTADTTVQAVYTINNYAVMLPTEHEGYELHTTQELTAEHGASFRFTLTFAEEYEAGKDFAVKANGTALTAENGVYTITGIDRPQTITVEGVTDVVFPTAEITVKDNSWKEFLNTISFGLFYNESQDVTITAADKGSGVDKTEYHLSGAALTLEEVKALPADAWTEYKSTFSINPDGKYVVYARTTDRAGNTTYVSSDGMIMDATAPVITGMENNGVYYGDQTFQMDETYLKEIQIDGRTVEVTDGSIQIPADNRAHIIKLTDQAGNDTTYEITVYKVYTVEFVVDGKKVDTKQVNHGSAIPADKFPAIPAKPGYDQTTPKWNPESLENVTADTTVKAVYTPNRYTVALPGSAEGYTVRPQQGTDVAYGEDYSFTIEIAEGYQAGSQFHVYAGDKEITAVKGVYTIPNVQGAVDIRVQGVEKVVILEKGNYYYKVTDAKKHTVQVLGVKNTNQTKITVYNNIVLGGEVYKITSVAENAFQGYTKATSATIGKYVRVIGKNAFAGCTNLKKVTVNGNALRQIRKNAFKGCKKLAQVVIKSKKLRKVEKYAFRNIRKNAVIKVPASRYQKYKKLFAHKGMPKTVKIKKIKK